MHNVDKNFILGFYKEAGLSDIPGVGHLLKGIGEISEAAGHAAGASVEGLGTAGKYVGSKLKSHPKLVIPGAVGAYYATKYLGEPAQENVRYVPRYR